MPEFTYDLNIWFRRIVNFVLFNLNGICFTLILVKRKLSFRQLIITVSMSSANFTIAFFIPKEFYMLLDLATYFTIGLLCTRKKWYFTLLETFVILVITLLFQALSLIYKDINLTLQVDNFIVEKLLMIDYYILLVLTILHEFKKGDDYHGRWKRFLANLSKQKCFRKVLPKTKDTIQESLDTKDVSQESGFKIFIVILSVFQLTLVWTCCYFVNHIVTPFIVTFISFIVLRAVFGKSYHANSVIKCTSLSIIVFVAATRLGFPPYISMLLYVLLGCLVAYTMYVMYYFIKYTNSQGITFQVGMDLKTFEEAVGDKIICDVDYNILKYYYVDRMSILQIASKVGYSTESVKKHKAKTLKNLDLD